MENHVSGQVTASAETPDLGQLRRAFLAVLIGNPHFTPQEQQQGCFWACLCHEPQRLAVACRYMRRETARRAQVPAPHPALATAATHATEVFQLAQCPLLDAAEKRCFVAVSHGADALLRAHIIGEAYLMLLERTHRLSLILN